MISTLSPPKVPVAEGRAVDAISSISVSSAMTLANAVPPRVMTISGVRTVEAIEVVARHRVPGGQGVDAVGLRWLRCR